MDKNSILTAAITASTLIGITSCNKDKKFENRIDGDWKINSYTINGVELKSYLELEDSTILELDFDKDGDYKFSSISMETYNGESYNSLSTIHGQWTIDDGELTIDYDGLKGLNSIIFEYYLNEEVISFSSETYNIEKLKGDDLKLEGEFEGVTIKIDATRD